MAILSILAVTAFVISGTIGADNNLIRNNCHFYDPLEIDKNNILEDDTFHRRICKQCQNTINNEHIFNVYVKLDNEKHRIYCECGKEGITEKHHKNFLGYCTYCESQIEQYDPTPIKPPPYEPPVIIGPIKVGI